MAAAVSQLCVGQWSTLLDCFIQHKGRKVEQMLPLFHQYLYLFFKFRRASVLFFANLACQVLLYRYLHRARSRFMAKEEKSTFHISSLLLSSFISLIYTRERLLLAKSATQSEVKRVSRTPMSSNYCTEKKFCPPQSSLSHRNQRL